MTRLMKPGMVLILAYFSFLFSSHAQFQQNWGTGMYPAQPACGYQNSIGDEATSLRDELNERTRELQSAKSDLRRLKSRQSSARSSVTAQRDLFKLTGIDGPTFNAIESHVNSGRSCNSYRGYCQRGQASNTELDKGPVTYPAWWIAWAMGKGLNISQIEAEPDAVKPVTVAKNSKVSRNPAADLGGVYPEPENDPVPETEPPQPQPPANNGGYRPPPQRRAPCQDGPDEWSGGIEPGVFFRHCGPRPGEVQGGICDENLDAASAPKGRNPNSCRKYLSNWQEKQREAREMENQIAELEAKILELEALTKASKVELAEAMKERERAIREGTTEGGCIDCAIRGGGSYQQPQRSGLWDLAGGIIAAGVNAYSSYKLGQYVSNNNARLGFQTQQIPLSGHILSAGWPMIQGGLYGVLGGGGGQGSFGCGGGPFGGGQQFGQNGFAGVGGFAGPYGVNGMQGNAMFGFPQQMFGSPAGGGMFNVGMGAGFSPGYGAQAYCPVQPCPVNGQFGLGGQFGGGFPGMPGGQFGGAGYNPFAPGGGLNLGFSAGFGGGIPGYGGPGMPYGGQFGGQFGGGYPGMPGGYMGMPGMNGGAWAGTPQPFGAGGQFGGQFGAGGYPGMPGYGGQFGGQFGGPGGQFGNYQYQQQLAQQQAQQYAILAQQQQQRYQAYMAQQQTVSNLYGEMYSLQNRLQSAQMQMQSGGYLGFESSLMPGYAQPYSGMPYGNTAITPQPYPAQGVPGGAVPSFSR